MDDFEVEPSSVFSGTTLPEYDDSGSVPQAQERPAPVQEYRPLIPMPAPDPTLMPPGQQQFAYAIGTDAAIPNEDSHMLGLSLVVVGAAIAIGTKYGGAYGAASGGLLGGASVNALRAFLYYKRVPSDPTAKKEALVSATYAAIGIGTGLYMWYKLVQQPALTRNSRESHDEEPRERSLARYDNNGCGMRRAGP